MSEPHSATLAPAYEPEYSLAVLGVYLGGEAYGFPLASVHEILIPPPLTEVPRAPNEVLGVITVRGQIVTVIDLMKVLRLEDCDKPPYGRILLVHNGTELVGVAVDSVIQVYRLQSDQVEYASSMSADLADYVVGIGRVGDAGSNHCDDMLILIDPVSLLGA